MGLVKAAVGSAGGVLADQWKEYYYCEALPQDVLAAKGVKRTSGRSSNTKASDNIITSGSVIAVNEGQCMRIMLAFRDDRRFMISAFSICAGIVHAPIPEKSVYKQKYVFTDSKGSISYGSQRRKTTINY